MEPNLRQKFYDCPNKKHPRVEDGFYAYYISLNHQNLFELEVYIKDSDMIYNNSFETFEEAVDAAERVGKGEYKAFYHPAPKLEKEPLDVVEAIAERTWGMWHEWPNLEETFLKVPIVKFVDKKTASDAAAVIQQVLKHFGGEQV